MPEDQADASKVKFKWSLSILSSNTRLPKGFLILRTPDKGKDSPIHSKLTFVIAGEGKTLNRATFTLFSF